MQPTINNEQHIQLPFSASHAFIVGINDYENLSPLSTAVNDAEVLAKVLAKDHAYQVHPPLLNASKRDLTKLLRQDIPKLVGPNDRIFFYFAGHGIALDSDDDPNGYLVPADAQPGDSTTLIAMQELHHVISNLTCQHGMLILDCCFAGVFKWATGFRDVVFDLPGIIYEERLYQYAQDPAWQVITSSASDQKAVDILVDRTLGMREESNALHSPFAQALLDGLSGDADTIPKERGDGVITATELYTYLRDRVEDETTKQGKRQSPSMFSLQKHNKGQYIFLHPRHPLNLPPIPDRNPFMGLKSYNEADNGLFYGRDRVITALEKLIAQKQLVVVSGASGTGKSSVIKAGLLPTLRKQDWQILPVVRPGKEPLESLQESLPEGIPAGSRPMALIIDQYEELITQCLHSEDRIAFESQLAQWITTHSQLHIIISIRADFEPQFEEGALAKWWQSGRLVVPAFSLDELREVIIKPTVQEVLFFEPDSLVDNLVDAVNQAPGALPLLSFTLSELYHAYINSGRTNRAFTIEDYEKLGGVIGALRTRANSIYDELDPAHQYSMRKLMLRMVSLEGGELASRRVFSDDLIFSDEQETERMEQVAQHLVSARLVSTDRDQHGRTYYEPTHDALVRSWARLWEWIKAQGEAKLNLMYKLSLAVTDYQAQQERAYLWHEDPRLDLLYADLLSPEHNYNAQEEAFLQQSNALRRRNQRRRWAIITGVIIGLAGLAIYAFIQQGIANTKTEEALTAQERADQEAINARVQADSALAAQGRAERFSLLAAEQRDSARIERDNARRERDRANQEAILARAAALSVQAKQAEAINPTDGLNIAIEAFQLAPSEESRSALSSILSNQENNYYQTLEGHSYFVSSVAFSPNGKTVLTGSWDETVQMWSTSNGESINTYRGHEGDVNSVAFSPDGKTVLSGSADRTAKLWALDGQELRTYKGHSNTIWSVAFSPDGQNITTGSADNTAKLWNLGGQKRQIFNGHIDDISCLVYLPDGEMILTGSEDNTAIMWTLEGGIVQTFEGHKDDILDIAISPDGKTIATSSSDKTAKLWNLDGTIFRTLEGHSDEVSSIDFSPDGKTVLTGSLDKTAKMWNLQGQEIQTFQGHTDAILSVDFSPNGNYV
ncbi:MAG: caspase family protein, partial [Bacteroidota bacterium]